MSKESEKIKFEELAHKYVKGTITPAEQQEFDEWFNNDDEALINIPEHTAQSEDDHRQLILSKIHHQINVPAVSVIGKSVWARIAIAASVILCISLGYYFIQNNDSHPSQSVQINKILPGSNKAILTLANGQQLILTGAKIGQLASQGKTTINKTADGQIVYSASSAAAAAVVYNTIAIPKGGQYCLTLTDGTKVWLNSASTLKYPTVFTGSKREVELTGEAYFEVAKNKSKPFLVHSANHVVEVLGTHFNINAYADEEAVETTLLEGSVKVHVGNRDQIIVPGQQSVYTKEQNSITVNNAELENVVAWKNGVFAFDDTELDKVMRQISRWYDVEIIYQGVKPDVLFTGGAKRNGDINKILHMLEFTGGVKFTVKDKQIIVQQKQPLNQ